MRHSDRTVKSIGELLEHLRADTPQDQPTWFRGLRNSAWNLEPSLARGGGIDREMPLILRFRQNAFPHISPQPTSEWEWLFVMQHYGLPTRLLDWTESALIGLYFAVWDSFLDSESSDGALWALLPMGLNKHSKFDEPNIPAFGAHDHLDQYLPSIVAKSTVTFEPLAAIAVRNTPRMQVQQGVFTITHKDLESLNLTPELDHLWRYVIPADAKSSIREELRILNITKLAIFPELSNVAEHAKDLTP